MLSLIEFAHLTYNKEKLIDFLIKHGVLAPTIKCNMCGNDINIDKDTLWYKCRKRHSIQNVHKKRVCVQCDFKKSAMKNT